MRVPRGVLRADLHQARRQGLRRRAAARHRPRRLRRDPDRDRDDRRGEAVCTDEFAWRESRPPTGSTSSPARAGPRTMIDAGRRRRRGRGGLAGRAGRVRRSARAYLLYPDDGREAAGVTGRDARGRRVLGRRPRRRPRSGATDRPAGATRTGSGPGRPRPARRRRPQRPALPAPPAARRHAAAGRAAARRRSRRCRRPARVTSSRRPTHPLYAGGVVLASRHGVVAVHDAAGQGAALRRRAGTELPAGPAGADATGHDLRPRVGVQAVHLDRGDAAGRGRPGRPRRAGRDVPPGVRRRTARTTSRSAHLLTHTAGLPAWLPLYSGYADGRGAARGRARRRADRRAGRARTSTPTSA